MQLVAGRCEHLNEAGACRSEYHILALYYFGCFILLFHLPLSPSATATELMCLLEIFCTTYLRFVPIQFSSSSFFFRQKNGDKVHCQFSINVSSVSLLNIHLINIHYRSIHNCHHGNDRQKESHFFYILKL